LGPQFGTSIWDPEWTPIWDSDLRPRFETLIWDPDLGPRFGTLELDPEASLVRLAAISVRPARCGQLGAASLGLWLLAWGGQLGAASLGLGQLAWTSCLDLPKEVGYHACAIFLPSNSCLKYNQELPQIQQDYN
jgi:hypothetical protein